MVGSAHTHDAPARAGAFVISLDFELLWGLRDVLPPDGGAYRANLFGVRQAVPRLLDLFAEYEVAATWATVGMLFARDRAERERHTPAVLPGYADARLSPYTHPTGACEADDPLHYAASLIERIRAAPRQEVGSHSFSHFFALAPGSSLESFRADIQSAVAIAAERGISPRSFVFPRNQVDGACLPVLAEQGFTAYRGAQPGWMHRPADEAGAGRLLRRAGRLVDAYSPLGRDPIARWDELRDPSGLVNVPASRFLRAWTPRTGRLERLQLQRIARGVRAAAESGGIYHLWWHPHNVGRYLDENLQLLRRVLAVVADCRRRHGLRCLTMAEAAEEAGCG